MNTKFYIFDNNQMHVSKIHGYIEKLGYSKNDIWPKEYNTVEKWDKVWSTLIDEINQKRIRDDDCVILFLDLGLGEHSSDIETGVQQILEGRDNHLFAKFVWIIYSNNAFKPDFSRKVDALIYKSELQDRRGDATNIEKLKLRIRDALQAWERRTGKLAPSTPIGSKVTIDVSTPAGCSLVADLGQDRIEALKRNGWPSMRVEALTGGYSGAYVVRFIEEGGNQELVAKISKDNSTLLEELENWKQAVASTVFNGILNSAFDVEEIDGLSCMVMASAQGRTLEERTGIDKAAAGNELNLLFERGISAAASRHRIQPCPLMALEPRSVQAFKAALPGLLNLRDGCARRDLLPPDFPTRETIELFATTVIDQWNARLRDQGLDSPITVPQHGDLNPRNIIIPPSGPPQLIDLARFGEWPVGYDLLRLELQLLLRLLGTKQGDESFPDQLGSWAALWDSIERGMPEGSEPAVPASLLDVLRAIANARGRMYAALQGKQPDAAKTTAAMRCFDALKMACYRDATDFKRLLFLYIAIRSARAANLMA